MVRFRIFGPAITVSTGQLAQTVREQPYSNFAPALTTGLDITLNSATPTLIQFEILSGNALVFFRNVSENGSNIRLGGFLVNVPTFGPPGVGLLIRPGEIIQMPTMLGSINWGGISDDATDGSILNTLCITTGGA